MVPFLVANHADPPSTAADMPAQDGLVVLSQLQYSLATVRRVLSRTDGVLDVRGRRFFGPWLELEGGHLTFVFRGATWVVLEPWGDNDRYWLVPADSSRVSEEEFRAASAVLRSAFRTASKGRMPVNWRFVIFTAFICTCLVAQLLVHWLDR